VPGYDQPVPSGTKAIRPLKGLALSQRLWEKKTLRAAASSQTMANRLSVVWFVKEVVNNWILFIGLP
jgi:hypothetical protein